MPSDNEIAEAEIHFSTCEHCKRYFQFNEQFQQLLKEKLANTVTPPSLRESLLQLVSEQSSKDFRFSRLIRAKPRWTNWAAAIFAVFVIGLAAFYLGLVKHSDESASLLPSLLIQDHIELQMRENPYDVQTSNKTELEQWFSKRVDFAVNIPVIQNAELRGGRLCYLLKKRVVFVVFEKETRPISAYILDGEGIDLSSLDQLSSSHGKTFYWDSQNGYNVVLWKSGGLIYAFVSSIDCDELQQLAAGL
ncbi:MAG: hypothetical protein HY033_11475 [Ignavibacteriae bacterium]|nr:hypothetical protein [Ignavibacteria bacterium]MBI3365517.1 hypothetical protein [Ignavibacteriota bacterium]